MLQSSVAEQIFPLKWNSCPEHQKLPVFLALCSSAVIFLSHCVGSDSQIHGNMDVTALRGQTPRAGGCYICKGSNEAGGDVKFYFHPLMLELSCKSNQTRACLGGCAAARTIPEHPPNIFLLSHCILHPAFPALREFRSHLGGGLSIWFSFQLQ